MRFTVVELVFVELAHRAQPLDLSPADRSTI